MTCAVGSALERYRDEWKQRNLPEAPGGSANEEMVKGLLENVDEWKKKLGMPSGDGPVIN